MDLILANHYDVPEAGRKTVDAQSDEMRRLKAELNRVTEERDIFEKGRGVPSAVSDYRGDSVWIKQTCEAHTV